MSTVVLVEREVMAVKLAAMARRFFHAMAHLAGEEFVSLLGLLATGDVEEDARHDPSGDALVVALTSGRDPSHETPIQDAEVDLVGTVDRAGRREGRPDPVPVGRVDLGGKVLELDGCALWQAPEIERALVHGERIGVDVPRPQGHTGGIEGEAQLLGRPNRRDRGL
jgi:hypothetical protein